MRNFLPVATLALLAVAGCKPKPEDQIPGTWTGPNNFNVTFTKDKSWTSDLAAGAMTAKMTGTWSASGNTITVTPTTLNGQPAAQVAKQLADVGRRMGLPKDKADALVSIVTPDDFTLSDDGKTLTKKNPKKGQEMTLTKKEG
jgi:hypothetical protein